MEKENNSSVIGFILLGFSISSQIKIVLFVVFLSIYLIAIAANGLIITVVRANSRLHSPMYFFICNLSFLEICFLSTNIPKCLEGFLSKTNTISFSGCFAQIYISLTLADTQCILLAVMAWDRYVAICNPLNYQRIMYTAVCIRLSAATWACGFLCSAGEMISMFKIQFCGHVTVNHVVCELSSVLSLACTDIHLIEAVVFGLGIVILVVPVSLIFFTYLHIISTILRIPTAAGRQKAFSTCGSHLAVVSIFYGTLIVIYMSPRSAITTEKEKVISLVYGLVTPALNPLIYTLRNMEVKQALKKLLGRNMDQPDIKIKRGAD